MKRLIAILTASVLLMSTLALAEMPELSDYSMDELLTLRQQVDAAMLNLTRSVDRSDATLDGLVWVSNGAEVRINAYEGTATEVVVPAEINGLPVTRLQEGVFRDCKNLTSVTLPDTITEIPDFAFDSCTRLTTVNIPASVTHIGDLAFQSCDALKSVILPEGLKTMGHGVFQVARGLNGVMVLPSTLTNSVNSAFYMCDNLRGVVIQSDLEISALDLYGESLEFVYIREGAAVSFTGDNTEYFFCPSLRLIIIPASVTNIVPGIFEPCNHVTVVTPAGSYAEQYCRDNWIVCNTKDYDKYAAAYETMLTGTELKRSAPAAPTVSVENGVYAGNKTVAISHPEGHRIYYTFDPDARLPDMGVEYTRPIMLGEGEHRLRAVAVDGDLVSDELEAAYSIYVPTPLPPDANLVPNTYRSVRNNVRLWIRKLDEEWLKKNPGYEATLKDPVAQDITIYYTIDGSLPDSDSPVYHVGDAIVMQTEGVNYLRAVSVNGYYKQSSVTEVVIQIHTGGETPLMYNTEDCISGMKLAVTTRKAFETLLGKSEQSETVWLYGVDGECERVTYPWGYVTYAKQQADGLMVELYLEDGDFDLPRETSIGMTEDQIVSNFKDFRQVVSPSGNRGLYESESNKGKIYARVDGGKTIRYRTMTDNFHIWQLDYILDENGVCSAVHWIYER